MIPMLASRLLSQGQPIRSEAGAPAMFPSTFPSTVLPMGLSEAIVEPKGEQRTAGTFYPRRAGNGNDATCRAVSEERRSGAGAEAVHEWW